MSEPTDEVPPQVSDLELGPPPAGEAAVDTDDVEVMPQATDARLASVRPEDSMSPTSRKLAPPPKPRRDSQRPLGSNSSFPAPSELTSSRAAPAISFRDAAASSREAVAAALTGSDSLRAIGEALAQNSSGFPASEVPTGSRPPVPRPRSQPALQALRDSSFPASGQAPPSQAPDTQVSQDLAKATGRSDPPRSAHADATITIPDDQVPLSAAPPSSASVFASRIIAVGVRSDLPPPPLETVEPALAAESPSEVPDTAAPEPEAATEVGSAAEPPDHVETVPLPPVQFVPPAAPAAAHEVSEPVARAEHAEVEAGPDSADRLQIEELSRDDAPSLLPDEPSTPPQQAAAKADGKQPPPPPKRPPGAAALEAAAASPEAEQKKKAKQKRAWWEELFSEDFVRASFKVTEQQIKKEVTFVEESLGVAAGGIVLDLGCGSGQHAVELASRGYGVVGYDLSLYQLALAADVAQERSQKINFLQGDMREMAFEEMFDGIFCWNTSFGYFEEDKNFAVAERVFRALRPGGMFLVDVVNRDFVAAHTPSSVWFEGDSCVCMDDAVIDYFTSRLRVKRSVILDDGRTRECTYSVRLYSFHELGKLLHEVGFRVTEVSGHPATPGVFLGQASPRILMLAQRP